MNKQEDHACEIESAEQQCLEKSDLLLPLLHEKCHDQQNLKASASSVDSPQGHAAVPEHNQTSPPFKRSDSFLIALSESAALLKSHGDKSQNNSTPSDDQHCTRQQKQESHTVVLEEPQEESFTSFSSGSSDEPACRICHEGEGIEELVSPCYCSGSVGLLHLSCLERWLGTSQSTRCELCKYEFTLKKMPRAFAEFMKNPPTPKHRSNVICDLACFIVLTPVTIFSAYLCANGVNHYAKWPGSWQVQGLTALTVCLIFAYFTWLTVAIHHHYNICKRWQKENQIVKILFISPVKSKRTLRSSSIASYKFESVTSPLTIPLGNVTARGSVSDRGSQPQPSLVVTPQLRPILKYSTQLQASSWQSGLSHCTADASYQTRTTVSEIAVGNEHHRFVQTRQETYV